MKIRMPMHYIVHRCMICGAREQLPEMVPADSTYEVKDAICESCCDAVKFVKENQSAFRIILDAHTDRG